MAEYQAKSKNSKVFDLTRGDEFIGTLTYESWFKFNALVEMANHRFYQIEPKGFWGTKIELKENGNVLLKFEMNWSSEIVIKTYSKQIDSGYILKHKGILKESFILADEAGIEILTMKPDFKWSKMSYEYQLTSSDSFEKLPEKEILLMAAIHGVNYYVFMMSASMASM
ncbi:MAG: hypothetical protein V4687_15065 [Bacteroidota bacterium]